MARVPDISMVPTVAPSSRPLPEVHIDSPDAAFGGATARAISGFAGTLGHVGNELYARAEALQQLKNETDAKDADLKFMMDAGKLHAEYSALQGMEKVNAYPKYSEDMQNLYKTHRGTLTNPMAQRMFDSSAVTVISRSLFNGAGEAASAQRQASLTAIESKEKLNTKQTFDNPDDEWGFRDSLKQVEKDAATKAALSPGGASPERVALITAEGKSELAYHRLLSIARNEPYKASQLLEQYKSEGLLFGNQLLDATNKIQSLTQTVGTKIIADQIVDKYKLPDGGFVKSATEMRDEAIEKAKKAYPNDPKMQAAMESAFDNAINRQNWAKRQEQVEVNQQMNDFIVKGAERVDQLPQELVTRMTAQQIKEYPAKANSYRAALDKQTNDAAYHNLLGLYNNDNAKFMDTDIMRYPGINKSNMDFFLKLQRKASANGDPRVQRAMTWLRSSRPQDLADMGVTGKSKNDQVSNQFVGALHEALQTWQEDKGKPATEKDVVDTIYPMLAQKVVDPDSWFFNRWIGNDKSPRFQSGVPEEFKGAVEKQLGKEVTPEEVRKLWLNSRFRQLYEKKGGAKDQDRVPQ